MSSVVLTGDTSGAGTITVPAVAGTFTATIGSATGTHYPFESGTAVASTSGTSIDFTSIPSWVKRITVMLYGVSTSGTSVPLIQLGYSGGVESTSYFSNASMVSTTSNTTRGTQFTTGFGLNWSTAAADVLNGAITITTISANKWLLSGTLGNENGANSNIYVSGRKETTGTLDRIRITTVNGTDTFDAGSINILYE